MTPCCTLHELRTTLAPFVGPPLVVRKIGRADHGQHDHRPRSLRPLQHRELPVAPSNHLAKQLRYVRRGQPALEHCAQTDQVNEH